MASGSFEYEKELQRKFVDYRHDRFRGHDEWFEQPHKGGATVFNRDHLENNLMIPPLCNQIEHERIGGEIPVAKRHRHFGSMQSSQALAQSVFGTIEVLNLVPLLSKVKAEDGLLAFGPMDDGRTKLQFEKDVHTLGELPPRTTSIDVWFEGVYRVAVECNDQRNPAMAKDGHCDLAWHTAHDALLEPRSLRRLSWQSFIAQWPSDEKLNWLKAEMGAKFGIV